MKAQPVQKRINKALRNSYSSCFKQFLLIRKINTRIERVPSVRFLNNELKLLSLTDRSFNLHLLYEMRPRII